MSALCCGRAHASAQRREQRQVPPPPLLPGLWLASTRSCCSASAAASAGPARPFRPCKLLVSFAWAAMSDSVSSFCCQGCCSHADSSCHRPAFACSFHCKDGHSEAFGKRKWGAASKTNVNFWLLTCCQLLLVVRTDAMGMPHLRRGGGLPSRGHHGSLQSKKQHAERLAQQYALAELQAERLTLEARVMKLKSEVRKSSRTEYQRQTETFSGSSMNPVQQKDGRLSKNDRSTSGHEKQLLLVSNGATMLSPGERVGAVRAGKSSAQGASRCAKQQAAPGEQSEESAGSAKGPHGRPHSIVEQIDVESLETADPAIGLYVGTWSELGLPDWQFPLVQASAWLS
eukprot:6206006-Pleurochrysis_carterae.AAC.1